MKISISYLATVIIAVLFVFIGHRMAVSGLFVFQDDSQTHVRAKVLEITERVQPDSQFNLLDEFGEFGEFDDFDDYDEHYDEHFDFDDFNDFDDFLPLMGERIIFEAQIKSGPYKGEIITASQNLVSFLNLPVIEIKKGNSVLLISFNNEEWFFNGYEKINQLIILGALFILCVILFGGKKGFNTILSLCLTCAAVFAVFIPSILSGKNIYIMAILICVYTTLMTLVLVMGYNKKSLAAAIGCISGILIAGIITVIMDRILLLTGVVDEHSRYLASLPVATPINLKAVIFGGIIIGAMGAIMDVAMSIASSLWEIKEKAGTIKFETLFRSGLNIGRDIMGSMANTLILAYIGSSLSVVLIISVYSNSLLELFNREMIIVEILQALAGSFGILSALPLTAFFSTVFYLNKEKKN
ncbi:MAG: YibE/F family protein [Treponema sp.]|nr:YibE/F family protein [Treponema sp.]